MTLRISNFQSRVSFRQRQLVPRVARARDRQKPSRIGMVTINSVGDEILAIGCVWQQPNVLRPKASKDGSRKYVPLNAIIQIRKARANAQLGGTLSLHPGRLERA